MNMKEVVKPFATFFWACELDCGPFADDEVVTSYEVQGISFNLTVGQFRKLLAAAGYEETSDKL